MSKSVVVNFVANALWQLHRFLQLCLRHRGKLVELLPPHSSHSAKWSYLKAQQSKDEEGRREKERGSGWGSPSDGGEGGHCWLGGLMGLRCADVVPCGVRVNKL